MWCGFVVLIKIELLTTWLFKFGLDCSYIWGQGTSFYDCHASPPPKSSVLHDGPFLNDGSRSWIAVILNVSETCISFHHLFSLSLHVLHKFS